MRLTVSIANEEAKRPLPATALLEAFKYVEFNNASERLRHPAKIYGVSMRSVLDAFHDAFRATDDFKRPSTAPERQQAGLQLSKAIDHLLDATIEHFDDAKSILCLFADRFNRELGKKTLPDFNTTVRDARSFSAIQANEIKHQQGRVRLIQASSRQAEVLGYFIECVDESGSIAPSPNVHKGATAFSLGRAFRQLACSVLFASRALRSTLDKVPAPQRPVEHGLGSMYPIFATLASWDRYVFWDEVSICPDIVQGANSITIDTPPRKDLLAPPSDARMQLIVPIFDSNDTFRLPYMGSYQSAAQSKPRYPKDM